MNKLTNLLEAFRDLDALSISVGIGYLHIIVSSDAKLLLLAKILGATPTSRGSGGHYWLGVDARLDGTHIMIAGPQHEIVTPATAPATATEAA